MATMSGSQHYQRAESLLRMAANEKNEYGFHAAPAEVKRYVARAQVHATLALAAATALNHGAPALDHADYEVWKQVAGTRQAPRS